MVRNFVRDVAPELIIQEPGHVAEYYAEKALAEHLSESNAENPIFSLASTLAKTVREERLDSVRRERVDGAFLYFPTAVGNVFTTRQKSTKPLSSRPSVSVRVQDAGSPLGSSTDVEDDLAEILDLMNRLSISRSKADGLVELATRWLSDNRDWVTLLRSNAKAIESMRDQIRGRQFAE